MISMNWVHYESDNRFNLVIGSLPQTSLSIAENECQTIRRFPY